MKNFLSIFARFLTILLLLSGLTACRQGQLVDEKMELIEGYYLSGQAGVPFDDPGYQGQILRQGAQWVFRFTYLFKDSGGAWEPHTFIQPVTWNPVVGTYVFETLPEAECRFFVVPGDPSKVMTHYEPGKIVVVAYSGSFDTEATAKAARYVWTKAN